MTYKDSTIIIYTREYIVEKLSTLRKEFNTQYHYAIQKGRVLERLAILDHLSKMLPESEADEEKCKLILDLIVSIQNIE